MPISTEQTGDVIDYMTHGGQRWPAADLTVSATDGSIDQAQISVSEWFIPSPELPHELKITTGSGGGCVPVMWSSSYCMWMLRKGSLTVIILGYFVMLISDCLHFKEKQSELNREAWNWKRKKKRRRDVHDDQLIPPTKVQTSPVLLGFRVHSLTRDCSLPLPENLI